MKKPSLNLLSASVSAALAVIGLTHVSVSQAADTEIYQIGTKGETTLIFQIDVSTSMQEDSVRYDYGYHDGSRQRTPTYRWTGSFQDVSPEGVVRNYYRVPVNQLDPKARSKVVNGCSPVDTNGDGAVDEYRCYWRISRLKDAFVQILEEKNTDGSYALADNLYVGLSVFPNPGDRYSGSVQVPALQLDAAHRQLLIDTFKGLGEANYTPTANAYAESLAYFFGTSTESSRFRGGFYNSVPSAKIGSKYKTPESLEAQIKDSNLKQCSAQGIYILTDGEPNSNGMSRHAMNAAFAGKKTFNCRPGETNQWEAGWACMHEAATAALDPNQNPLGIQVKTAVVGFGDTFSTIPSYDKSKTKKENLDMVDAAPSVNWDHAKNAARLGIIGEGGWYYGSSTADVIASVKGFLNNLPINIPKTTAGQPLIPVDPLRPFRILPDAYYASFDPQPNQKLAFWQGDINRYLTKDGKLYGVGGNELFSQSATPGGNATMNDIDGFWGRGMASKLPLRGAPSNTNRKIMTNIGGQLTQVTLDEIYNAGGKVASAPVASQLAWLNLLGYNIPLSEPTLTPRNDLDSKTAELRQLGAVMHSTPTILTQRGSVSNDRSLTVSGRQDYVMFGSTQGVLHIVDPETGTEVFGFVPHEFMDDPAKRSAFQHVDNAVAEMSHGVDGRWTAYTQFKGNSVQDVVKPTSAFLNDGIGGAGKIGIANKGLQWVYGGLRMGGRSYYGLDVSDIDNPSLKFHINPAGATAGSAISHMGQSWSKPNLGFINWQGQRRLVMFVGGGYDTRYENRTYVPSGNDAGAGVYMFDAHDGSLLWWSSDRAGSGAAAYTHNGDLTNSVVSDITTYDRDGDGLIDNLLFGDLGGQVFRVDIDNTTNDLSKFATTIRLFQAPASANGLIPRFYEAPSLSAHEDSTSNLFGAVSIASGNRSSPLALDDESAKDALFVIYDHNIFKQNASGYNPEWSTGYKLQKLTGSSSDTAVTARNGQDYNRGWYYELSSVNGQVKGFGSPNVVDNFLFLNTYDPKLAQVNACGGGIIGESSEHVFCFPGGICSDKQIKQVIPDGTNFTPANRTMLFTGIIGEGAVSSAQGTINGGSGGSVTTGQYGPNIDCKNLKPTDPNYYYCLSRTGNINNKTVRWYEYNPRG